MRLKFCFWVIFCLLANTGCMTPSSNLNESLINSGALLEKDYLKFLASAAISSRGSIVLTNPTINQIPNNSASSLLDNPGSINVGSLTFFGSSNPSDIYISDRAECSWVRHTGKPPRSASMILLMSFMRLQ